MWVSVLVILSLCGGIWGKKEDICEIGWRVICMPSEFPFQFPETAEEMDHLCPIIQNYLMCIINYNTKCNETVFQNQHLTERLPYLQQVCKKDSDDYRGVVKHLPCFKEMLDTTDETCWNLTGNAIRVYAEHQIANDPNYADSYFTNNFYCFLLTHEIACSLAKVERKCDPGAKEIILDAQKRTAYFDERCLEELEDILKLIQILELDMDVRDLMKEIILVHGKS